MLATLLPQDIKCKFKSIVLDDAPEDILIWNNSTNGIYSAKSGYQWLHDSTNDNNVVPESWSCNSCKHENVVFICSYHGEVQFFQFGMQEKQTQYDANCFI